MIFKAQLSFNSRIRPFLSRPEAERLIHAFIRLRLDYCNSLFVGLAACFVKRLQYIQDSAVLTYISSRHHITPVLQQLHWLPVQSCIDFKTLILDYKAVHGLAPDCIYDLVTRSILRLSNSLPLNIRTASTRVLQISFENPSFFFGFFIAFYLVIFLSCNVVWIDVFCISSFSLFKSCTAHWSTNCCF